ncbi:MAG: chitobiase/beta-hexosaminidase C-terminal domain-containing protein, partial [Muribaculaceae bacterium]|nr:chitobiase/beta-hexosaminidase C-terminal domain-containing protein [Muribaculaceae bacterium]
MKKILLTLLLCLTLGAASAWAEEQVAFELKFLGNDYTTNGASGYTNPWTHTYNNYTWKLVGFNNNWNKTTGWKYVKGVAKNKTNATVSIATQTVATEALTSITINMQKPVAGATFTGFYLEIADNANFTNPTKQSLTYPTFANTSTAVDYTISIDTPQPDKYYRINFTLTNNTGTNGALQVNSIKYLYDDTPAGPVEPGTVLVNGAAAPEDEILLLGGETITFTSDKAAKLGYTIEYNNDPETGFNEGGSTYTHTVDFTKGNVYTITVTPYNSEGTAYTDKEAIVMVSKKLVKPEAVLVNGEAAKESYELAPGEKITFTSANATKLEFESEELDIIDEIEGTTYTHTADFTNAAEYILTVTPCDNYGNLYKDLAAEIMIFRKAAELCGEITFTPADGFIASGDAVKLSCENATEIKYTLDGGEELTYNDETGIVITKATTIKAWGINGDGVKGAEKEFTIALLLCGEITFTPADGKVLEGGAITITCENATEIKYTIDGGEELTYDDATGI